MSMGTGCVRGTIWVFPDILISKNYRFYSSYWWAKEGKVGVSALYGWIGCSCVQNEVMILTLYSDNYCGLIMWLRRSCWCHYFPLRLLWASQWSVFGRSCPSIFWTILPLVALWATFPAHISVIRTSVQVRCGLRMVSLLQRLSIGDDEIGLSWVLCPLSVHPRGQTGLVFLLLGIQVN